MNLFQFLNQGGVVLDGPGAVFNVPVDNGIVATAGTISLGAAGTIVGSGTLTSAVIPTANMPHFSIGATLSNAGSISVQRYLDAGGLVTTGSAITQALTAATAGILDNLGTVVAQSLVVKIINSGTAAGTLSNVAMALAAK